MNPIELTLTSLRRTHLGLVVVALAVLVVGSVRGRNYGPAIEEAQLVRQLLDTAAMAGICRRKAQEQFDQIWTRISRSFAESELPRSDAFAPAFTAYCPHPLSTQPLNEIAAYLDEGLWVDVPEPDSALVPLLVANGRRGELQEALIVWDTATEGRWLDHVAMVSLTDPELNALNVGEDSLDVLLLYQGSAGLIPIEEPALGDLADTTAAALPVVEPLPPGVEASVSLRVPGRVSQRRLSPAEILAAAPQWDDLLGEPEADGRLPVFPDLQPFLAEVGAFPPGEAALRLETLAQQEGGEAELLGVQLPAKLLGWVGPVLALALVLYFLLNVKHLSRITPEDPVTVRRYPLFALFGDPLAVGVTALTVVLLPVLACLVMAWRLAGSATMVAVVAALMGVLCGVSGVQALLTLKELRVGLARR